VSIPTNNLLSCANRYKQFRYRADKNGNNNIDVVGHAAIRQPPRRLNIHRVQAAREEVEKMLQAGVIRESQSSWSWPIVLVTKKDGSVRFCVDYCKLNEVTVKDAYPLPRIDTA
jgi:hypothetical protein